LQNFIIIRLVLDGRGRQALKIWTREIHHCRSLPSYNSFTPVLKREG
jgi:hypothetical protein